MEQSNFFSNPSVIWFIVGLIIFLLELAAPGLVLFFFGIGAWIVAIVCLIFDIPIYLQLLIFLITSVVSLLLLRKYFTKLFQGRIGFKSDRSGIDSEVAGKRVKVIEKISPNDRGKVELHGTNWIAEADEEIEVGATVEIVSVENLTIKVKKI